MYPCIRFWCKLILQHTFRKTTNVWTKARFGRMKKGYDAFYYEKRQHSLCWNYFVVDRLCIVCRNSDLFITFIACWMACLTALRPRALNLRRDPDSLCVKVIYHDTAHNAMDSKVKLRPDFELMKDTHIPTLRGGYGCLSWIIGRKWAWDTASALCIPLK